MLVCEVTTGVVLDVNAVVLEHPNLWVKCEVITSIRTVKVPEPAVAANGGRVGSEPFSGQTGGSDTGTRAKARMEGFRHRPEVAFETSRRGRSGVKRVHGFFGSEIEEGSSGGGRTKRAEGGGRVPAVVVVVGADWCSEHAFEFEAGGECCDEVAPRCIGLTG